MAEYKFRVRDKNHSAQIQELLFDLGFHWSSDTSRQAREVQNTDKNYLFADTYDDTIMYINNGEDMYFENDSALEAILAHPNQLKFLERINKYPDTMVGEILSNKFYLKRDADTLNSLLQQRIHKTLTKL